MVKSKIKTAGNEFCAEEVAESYINGNISWVRKQIGEDRGKFVDVQDTLREMGQDEYDMSLFNKRMTASKNASTKKTSDYQGYKNYPTWNVSLWIDNDQGLSETVREQIENLEGDLTPADKDSYSDGVVDLSQWLKSYVEDENPLAETSDVYTDLLQSAIDEVDFHEIAEELIRVHMERAAYTETQTSVKGV